MLRRGARPDTIFPADSPALLFRLRSFGKRRPQQKTGDVGAERQAERRQFINGKPALPKIIERHQNGRGVRRAATQTAAHGRRFSR